MQAMEECWRYLSPQTKEKNLARKWMACIFEHRKVPSIYVGQILICSLDNEPGLAAGELDCLEQKLGSSDGILQQRTSDIDVFSVKNIIAGPLWMIPIKGQQWEFPKHESFVKLFENVKKIHCNILYVKNAVPNK